MRVPANVFLIRISFLKIATQERTIMRNWYLEALDIKHPVHAPTPTTSSIFGGEVSFAFTKRWQTQTTTKTMSSATI